jgi:hypothetical protein
MDGQSGCDRMIDEGRGRGQAAKVQGRAKFKAIGSSSDGFPDTRRVIDADFEKHAHPHIL